MGGRIRAKRDATHFARSSVFIDDHILAKSRVEPIGIAAVSTKKCVVACTANKCIIADSAIEPVIPSTAIKTVVPAPAGHHVIVIAGRHRVVAVSGLDAVITGLSRDDVVCLESEQRIVSGRPHQGLQPNLVHIPQRAIGKANLLHLVRIACEPIIDRDAIAVEDVGQPQIFVAGPTSAQRHVCGIEPRAELDGVEIARRAVVIEDGVLTRIGLKEIGVVPFPAKGFRRAKGQ